MDLLNLIPIKMLFDLLKHYSISLLIIIPYNFQYQEKNKVNNQI